MESNYFKFYNKQGRQIRSNCMQICENCIKNREINNSQKMSCPINQTERINGKIEINDSITFLCTSDNEVIKSSKLFKKQLKIYASSFSEIEGIKNGILREVKEESNTLLHNIVNFNAKTIQAINGYLLPEQLGRNYQEQIDSIINSITNEKQEWARRIFGYMKNSISMKVEISVFRRFIEENPEIKLQPTKIKSAILNTFHLFFDDFSSKEVYVEIKDSNQKLLIDHEIFQVAITHFADNATKYVAPNSRIIIDFKETTNNFKIIFDMISIPIDNDERYSMCDKGFSGNFAKANNLNGNGIGMYYISKALDFHEATLNIEIDVERTKRKRVV